MVTAAATIDAVSGATTQSQSEFIDSILSSGILHFSKWAAIALDPWWGNYTGTLTSDGTPLSMSIDYGGAVTVTWTSQLGPVNLTGTMTDVVNGLFTVSGTVNGNATTLAGMLSSFRGGAAIRAAITGFASLTDQTTPLNAAIYASTQH